MENISSHLDSLNACQQEAFALLNLDETEKGNIWLVHSEENYHNAWIRLGGNRWLEITIRPCNYPGLTVKTVSMTDKELADHINQEFNSGLWIVRKMNLSGVFYSPETLIVEGKPDDSK